MVVKHQLRLTDVGNLSELKPRGFVGENFDMNDCVDVDLAAVGKSWQLFVTLKSKMIPNTRR